LGVSLWQLPGEFRLGFSPPPPVAIPVAEPPHPEAPNAVLVRPDGREAVVALENRLIFYAMDNGRVVRAFDGPGGVIRAAAWAPDGAALLVSAFYNSAAYRLDAGDGHVRGRFAVEREGAAVAFAADGRALAVASEAGPVALFDAATAQPLRMLRGARGPVRALTFVGESLIAAGDDGVLRSWDTASGALRIERRLAPTLRVMAVNSEGTRAAVAGLEPHIELIALADGSTVETLTPPAAQILALTWVGSTLISADSDGRVALWPLAGRLQ
jgi:WD40 repeat protein